MQTPHPIWSRSADWHRYYQQRIIAATPPPNKAPPNTAKGTSSDTMPLTARAPPPMARTAPEMQQVTEAALKAVVGSSRFLRNGTIPPSAAAFALNDPHASSSTGG